MVPMLEPYHSSIMEDPPADYRKFAPLTEMVEIAEKDGRTGPCRGKLFAASLGFGCPNSEVRRVQAQ